MSARLPRIPTFGTDKGGVQYATTPRHDLRAHIGAYAPTGCENAPVEGMEDDAKGERWYVALAGWLAIVAAAATIGVLL